MKKEIIKNDKKWIFEKDENKNYTVYYKEYSKICDCWYNVSYEKNVSEEVVKMYQAELTA